MFGSLVVALPTKHEGGTFPLRHHGREWVFNSAELVSLQISESESSRAAFVAFFGDIEHEVTEVKSGYRITLTYNLYFGDDKSTIVPPIMLPVDDTEAKIKKSLRALLHDPKFLPEGGLVGFGLSHLYPIGSRQKGVNLRELGKNLKGTDATIKRACDSLSLENFVKTVYTSYYNREMDGVACLLDGIADPDPDEGQIEEDILLYLHKESSGLLVYDVKRKFLKEAEEAVRINGHDSEIPDVTPILWLRPVTERNQLQASFVRYGNEASLEYVYGEICLVIQITAHEDRET